MAQSLVVCVLLVAALSAMVGAQQSCQSVTGMQGVNATKLAGVWYESARAPASTVGCVHTYAVLANNNTMLNVTTSYSSSNSSLYMNQRATAVLNITSVNTNAGFNVVYHGSSTSNTTFKILDTDYTSYVTVCGYSNANANSSFGAVFTTSNSVNYTWLGQVVNNSSGVLLNFNSSLIANVTQKGCYASSASTSVPYLTSVFAALLLIAKFLY